MCEKSIKPVISACYSCQWQAMNTNSIDKNNCVQQSLGRTDSVVDSVVGIPVVTSNGTFV